MKKMRRFLLIISVFYASQAFAFIPPPGPISPVIDFVNDVVETGKALMKKARTVADEIQYYRDEALNAIKSAQNFINLDLSESPLQKEEGSPVLAAAKEIVESKLGDLKNEQDVSNMFQQLFLTYPIDVIESFPAQQREFIMKKYHDKSVEFSNDSMMELYLTIRDLEENRLPAMKKELDDLSDCFVSGKSGSSSLCSSASDSDEELGNMVNKYKLYELQDSYARMYEELVALKVQYNAAAALQEGVTPFNEEEALSTEPSKAQVSATKNSGLNFEIPDLFHEKTPFEGAEDNMTALPILDGIYDLLNQAQYLHNTKQQLPNLRRPFLEYEKMDALRRVADKKLLQSENHVRDYLKTYYQDADGLWFGDGCSLKEEYLGRRCPKITGCKNINEYVKYDIPVILCSNAVFQMTEFDKRRGMAKNAYDLYTGAKVEQVLSLNDNNDENNPNKIDGVAVVDMDMDTTMPDVDEEVDLESMIGGGDDLVKDSDASYAEGVVREQDLNRWQIGAIESLKVGTDMNGGKSKYGLKKKYPLWQDEMRFYDQYLREKYRNMELYFNNPMIAHAVFALARKINDDMEVLPEAVKQCGTNAEARKISRINDCWYMDTCKRSNGTEYECKKTDNKCIAKAKSDAVTEKTECEGAFKPQLDAEKNGNKEIIDRAQKAFESNPFVQTYLASSSALEEFKRGQEDEIKALENEYKQNLMNAFMKRNDASNKLNIAMEHLNEEKTQYNDLMGKKKDAESEAAAQNEVVSLGEKKSKENPDTPYITNIPNEAETTQKQKMAEAEAAQQDALGHQGAMKNYQNAANKYRDLIKKADEDIEKVKKDYIIKAVALEGRQMVEMKEKLANRIKEIKALPIPSFEVGTQTIGQIAEYATNMFVTFRQHAIEEVVNAYKKIEALDKAAKYEADRYDGSILPIHQTMITNIKNAPYQPLSERLGVIKVGKDVINGAFLIQASVNFVSEVFAKSALDSECDSTKEDAQYFVSLKGESCDLTAPKRMFADRTPPMREVFYFDTADYDAVLKTEGRKKNLLHPLELPRTTRAEFLKMGRDMPKIWQIILGQNGFVQRDVDLEDVLNQNISVAQRNAVEFHHFVMSRLNQEPKKESFGSEEFLDAKGERPVFGDVGELSVFLQYDNGLAFRDTIFAIDEYFDYVATTEKKIDEKAIKERKKDLLIRNQIGDYLQFVDIYQNYQTQVIQLKVKVNEGRRTIEDALQKAFCKPKSKDVGYVKDSEIGSKFVSSEFIADDEVYESVEVCLDQGKNMYIEEALKMMETLPQLTDYLQDRKKKLDNMLKAMQMDSDELVQLSDNTEPNGDFEEKIKSQKTDDAVVNKYADEAEKEFENNLNNFEIPYQARYF